MFILEMNQAVEKLKTFVLKHSLPSTDMALFGIQCPYCGKSDRIRELEEPNALKEKIDAKHMAIYVELWEQLARSNGSLGVCKFCQNLIVFQEKDGALPLYE